MSTFIDGVGQCQVIDKSGEIVDLKGHDITSLAKTGTFNWEHQANTPATLVGKILKAKKIFSKDDCENDRHLHFWNKCKTSYLYIMGELLDDYTSSAKECAGQMRYSRDNPEQAPLLGFSIEGSEIPNSRRGQTITRSIARKCTLTASPCNSMCVVEIYEAPDQKSQIKDDFDSIFKSTEEAINLFKSGEGEQLYTDYLAKKEAEPPNQGGKAPKSPYNEYENQGIRIGTTKSGKHVYSHGHVGDYDFNPAEHKEAGEHHRRAAVTASNPKLVDNHIQRMAAHNNAALSGGRQENRAALSLKQKDKVALEQSKQQVAKSDKTCKKHASLKKDSNVPPPPPEPNPASASAMQAGATQSGWQPSQWAANVKEGLGLNKSWSPGKVSGDAVHYSHPEHDIVSIQKQPTGEFHVKHQGKLAGIGGVKGSFSTAKQAGAHAKKYMAGLSEGKIMGPKMHNVASGANAVIKSESEQPKDTGWKKFQEGSHPFPEMEQHQREILPHGTRNKPHYALHVQKLDNGKYESFVGHHQDFSSHPKAIHEGQHDTKEQAMKAADSAHKQHAYKQSLQKSLEAGSTNAAPSTLTNGAAYQTESLSSSQADMGEHNFNGTKKKDWNKQAKEDYQNWPHREKFEKFMQARLPHLHLNEIKAIGRTIALKKTVDLEKSLLELVFKKK